jgi:hypothetical protein
MKRLENSNEKDILNAEIIDENDKQSANNSTGVSSQNRWLIVIAVIVGLLLLLPFLKMLFFKIFHIGKGIAGIGGHGGMGMHGMRGKGF